MNQNFKEELEKLALELAKYGWFVLPYRNYEFGTINLFIAKYKSLRGILYYGTFKEGSKELETGKIELSYKAYKELNWLLRRYGFLVYHCIRYVNGKNEGEYLCRHYFYFDSIIEDKVITKLITIVEKGLRLKDLG